MDRETKERWLVLCEQAAASNSLCSASFVKPAESQNFRRIYEGVAIGNALSSTPDALGASSSNNSVCLR
jgi:hypothetical protein